MPAQLQPELDVPDVDADAIVDPHFLELLNGRGGALPAWYMPAGMRTQLRGWRRGAAWSVVTLLSSAACSGICLTYGPEELWRILG